jgi:Domain of Unknown Function (DUF1080)
MRKSLFLFGLAALAVFISCAQNRSLPQPKVVTPAETVGGPPSDAVILFDGKDSSQWVHKNGEAAKWPVENGAIVCKTGSGDIFSKQKIGSAQIHVEFAIPYMPQQHDQARGNSGVYLQSRYEIQVLDSYQNPTYADGSAGALYGQYPPLANASRKPEEWQSYDIIFHSPQCTDGKVTVPGNLTLLHNGVLIQDHVNIKGPTPEAADKNVCEPAPLRLQDHHHPDAKTTFMRFRNIWYRQLGE